MRVPLFSICEFTTPDNTFEENLEMFAAHGATGIGITEEKLDADRRDEQLARFEDSGLTATVCLPTNVGVLPIRPELAYGGPTDPRERVDLMASSIRRLAPFRPDCIVVATGSEHGYERAEAYEIAVAGLSRAADIAGDMGTRLALEPCRNDNGFDASFVQGIEEAIELIEDVDSPYIGLCYDVYHHWHEPEIVSLTEKYADRVFGVQMNDWREPPRSLADRLLPGDGSIDLPPLVAALECGGYTGWYDLEVFSDDGRWGTHLDGSVWELPADEIVRRGMDGMRQVWASAGVLVDQG